jgi:competence protein ComEC
VQRLDLVVVTHPDHDHSGGLDAVIGAYPPRELWWGGAADHPRLRRLRPLLRAAGTRIRIPGRQRTRFRLGLTTIELIHPLGERRPELSDNDNSICLRVGYGGRHLLLPGDIEAATESRLLAERADQLSADVLKVAHHGSRGSSSLGFLAAVFPRVAVISAGLHNRFDFPHAEVLYRLRHLDARTYRTDLDGLVVVRMSSRGISVSTARGR